MTSLIKPHTSRLTTTSVRRLLSRNYATELPRPPPPAHQPIIETFSNTSRPRPYYAKHPPVRELPKIKKTWPVVLLAGAIGISSWAAFMTFVKNEEKISSSVFRGIMRCVREDAQLQEALGDVIRPQPEWWLNGQPMIHGHIGQLRGDIDVSFRIRGSKGSGTLYFTSIRKEKGVPFSILRFKVICDDGPVVFIDTSPV